MTEDVTTLDSLITSPPTPSASSSHPEFTHTGYSSEGPAVSEQQPATQLQTESSTTQKEEKDHLLDTLGVEVEKKEKEKEREEENENENEEGVGDKTNIVARKKRGVQQEIRFVVKFRGVSHRFVTQIVKCEM